MKSNLPKLIRQNKLPRESASKHRLPSKFNRNNYSKIIITVIVSLLLLIAVGFVGYRTVTYDNPNYVNVARVLPGHDWRIRFKTSSSLLNQRINMIASQQKWHFSKYGEVVINDQNAYNYLVSKHNLKLRNANNPEINTNSYLKFRLVKIKHNKRYVFKNVKSDAIPKENQRNIKLIFTKD